VRHRLVWVAAAAMLSGGTVAAAVSAAPLPVAPHSVVGGFAANGAGFSVVFADGSVRPDPFGDAFSLRLPVRITGAAAVAGGGGYWEVGADGNVFSYGTAGAFGGTGGLPLNQPIFAIASTVTGKGYWLFSRDGGVFTFGDAHFYGSAASLAVRQPIMGVTTSPTGTGYRLVSRDGGVFTFGHSSYAGSLPGLHVHVADVIGVASTPSGNGYWIARSGGHVYPFGDAETLGNGTASSCDRFTAIIANPDAQGYRLVKASGRSVGFGAVPGGDTPTGTQSTCGQVSARIEFPSTSIVSGTATVGYLVVDNETGVPLRLRTAGTCAPKWTVTLGDVQIPNVPQFAATCPSGPLVFPVGETQLSFTLRAVCVDATGPCPGPSPFALPPGQYSARVYHSGGAFPAVASVTMDVVAPT
jgi:hypothetical protein